MSKNLRFTVTKADHNTFQSRITHAGNFLPPFALLSGDGYLDGIDCTMIFGYSWGLTTTLFEGVNRFYERVATVFTTF